MGPNPHLSWVVHPLRQEPPLKSAALVLIIAAVSCLAAVSLEGIAYGALSAVVLGLSMARYFLPVRYTVDESGVSTGILRPRTRPWRDFVRLEQRCDGLFLSPFARPTRLDAYRGILVRFGPQVDGAAVAALAASRVRSHVAA